MDLEHCSRSESYYFYNAFTHSKEKYVVFHCDNCSDLVCEKIGSNLASFWVTEVEKRKVKKKFYVLNVAGRDF